MDDEIVTKDNFRIILFQTLLANTDYEVSRDSRRVQLTMDFNDESESVVVIIPIRFGITIKYFQWYIRKVSNYMIWKCGR